jgi:hypothetical protein
MRQITSVVLCLWLCLPAWGQSLKLPAEIKGEPGTFITITPETDGKAVKFITLDPGLSVFPSSLLKDSTIAVVLAGKPGRYRVLAYTAKGDLPSEPVITTVVVGDAPGPGPGPGPTPPPTPPDQLTQQISEALRYETDPDKAKLKDTLAALYRQGATVANNLSVTTWGQLFSAMQQAASTLGVRGKLPKVQAVISAHLSATLPTDPQRALAAERAKASETFLRVAAALEAAKE